jgi:hypothetical protein
MLEIGLFARIGFLNSARDLEGNLQRIGSLVPGYFWLCAVQGAVDKSLEFDL